MQNITLSADPHLIAAGRKYAKKNHTSLNALIRTLLERTVTEAKHPDWLDALYEKMDATPGDSKGRKWKREDLYRE